MFPLECETIPTSVSIKNEKHLRKKFLLLSPFFLFWEGSLPLFIFLISLGTP